MASYFFFSNPNTSRFSKCIQCLTLKGYTVYTVCIRTLRIYIGLCMRNQDRKIFIHDYLEVDSGNIGNSLFYYVKYCLSSCSVLSSDRMKYCTVLKIRPTSYFICVLFKWIGFLPAAFDFMEVIHTKSFCWWIIFFIWKIMIFVWIFVSPLSIFIDFLHRELCTEHVLSCMCVTELKGAIYSF